MQLFRQEGREQFNINNIPVGGGRYVRRSLYTTDPVEAKRMLEMMDVIVDRHATKILDRILAADGVSIPEVYEHWKQDDDMPFSARLKYIESQLFAVSLDQLVTRWAGGGEQRYLEQVRKFIPEGSAMGLGDFRRANIAAYIGSLGIKTVTKKKHLTAISMFARSLIEQELIDTNPCRDIRLKTPRAEAEASRAFVLRALTMDEAKLMVQATHQEEQAALEALMAGSMIEWSAADRLHGRHIDYDRRMVFADGKKTGFRSRWIEVTEDWAWDVFAGYARPIAPNAKVFHKRPRSALDFHHRTSAHLNLPHTRLHQYRHTFAITWIQRGAAGGMREDKRDLQWLKNQAGHAPSSLLLHTTYGVYINAAKLSTQQEERLGLANQNAPAIAVMK